MAGALCGILKKTVKVVLLSELEIGGSERLFPADQPVYFETAAVIITLVLLGRYLEHAAKGRASAAIKKLLGLQVKKAILLIGNRQKEVEINTVKVGDKLLVKPGAKIPVDAVILSGRSYVDESLVTGESMPVSKGPGDKVIVPPPQTQEMAEERLKQGFECVDWYFCKKKL